jgi:general secretion pathway protein L
MKSLTFSPVLFGLDLRRLGQDWSRALRGMAQWPGVRWLSPRYPVRLLFADQTQVTVYEHESGAVPAAGDQPTGYTGRVVAQDHLLWHALPATGLNEQDLASAIALEVQRLSPFDPGEQLHTYFLVDGPEPGQTTAHIAITTHKLLQAYLPAAQDGQATATPAGQATEPAGHAGKGAPTLPELWLQLPDRQTLHVLPGYGEQRRRQRTLWWRSVHLLLLGLIVLTLAAAALTPTLQLRERVRQAHDSYSQLQQQAVPAQQARERLVAQQDKVRQLQKIAGDRLVPENILLLLTQYLPDDTYLIVLEARAERINLVGVTPNANQLILHLEKQAGIKRVVTVTPARKEGNREVFTIEFILDTAAAAATAQASASPASAPVAAPASVPARKS